MTPAELRVVREWLGLTGEALGRLVGVRDRTIRRWEAGQDVIPDGVRVDIEHLKATADEYVESLVEGLLGASKVVLITYRTNEDFWSEDPSRKPFPASYHRAISARVAQEVPGLSIVYALGLSVVVGRVTL